MSTFVTLAQVKTILGITDTSDDTRLTPILAWVLDRCFQKVGNIEEWEKTEKILRTQRMLKDDILPFLTWPVTSIEEIDWTDFSTKVDWTDYQILDNGTAEVPDLLGYVETEFDHFNIKYTAWYATAPDDFIDIVATLVGIEFSKDMWKDVTEETTWPRTVKYADTTRGSEWVNALEKATMKRLTKYIPLHLRIY